MYLIGITQSCFEASVYGFVTLFGPALESLSGTLESPRENNKFCFY
jgi:hypothetical protein